MLWQSMQLVGAQPMNVFHCESCDKFTAAAAMPASNSGNSKIQNEAQP